MPRQKISRAELEQQLDGQVDPVSQLPPGFPTTHSKISPTPSKFVVAAIERVTAAAKAGDEPRSDGENRQRDEIRAAFHAVSRRR
jgi:hypothetical protein